MQLCFADRQGPEDVTTLHSPVPFRHRLVTITMALFQNIRARLPSFRPSLHSNGLGH